MKRFQPYFYLVALALLFVLAGLVLFSMHLWPRSESVDVIIDPQIQDEGGSLYDLWFTGSRIYDLDVDHGLTGILMSAENNKVNLLDSDRKLIWDKAFSTAPRQAKISSCGNNVVIGTEGGRLLYMSTDQQFWWDDQGLAVKDIAVSPNASWVAVSRAESDEDVHYLELFNRDGEKKWSIESPPIKKIHLSSEYLEQANIFYTYWEEEQPSIAAVDIDGENLWIHEGQSLAAVSKHGSRMAALEGDRLVVYNLQGESLWETNLPFEAKNVKFNPQNYNRLLIYGSREGSGENLYYFDLTDDLLWSKRIADGSLFAFTPDGQNIVTSSWRHYREDYTRMSLINRDGTEINSWEVAMQVERLTVSGHPHLVLLGGQDGYIDLVDLKPLLAESENDIQKTPLYSPVTTTTRADEVWILLYFIDENNNLVPVSRSISSTDNPLRAALEELVRGPARGSALYRTIPDKELFIDIDFSSEGGRLELDLSPDLVEMSGSTQSEKAFKSLLNTVSSFSEVKEIYLISEGEPIEALGEGPALEQPLEPHRWKNPAYVPVMSGNRYYLSIEDLAKNNENPELKEILEHVIRRCRTLPFVPSTLSLVDLKETPELVQVDLDGTARAVFPENAEEHEILRAALLLDALFLTVFENSATQRVEILIEGERWAPPAGYPSFSRFYRRPFFINPEQ